jgi:hypothetical protein
MLLPLVTLDLLQGVLERWQECLHTLRNCIRVPGHVDDLKRITNTRDVKEAHVQGIIKYFSLIFCIQP